MLGCRVAKSIRAGLVGNGSHVPPILSTTAPVSLSVLEHLAVPRLWNTSPCKAVGTHLPFSCAPVAKPRSPKEGPRQT